MKHFYSKIFLLFYLLSLLTSCCYAAEETLGEKKDPKDTLTLSLINSPRIALNSAKESKKNSEVSAFQPSVDLEIKGDFCDNPRRPVYIQLFSSVIHTDNERPVLFMEWGGGGVSLHCLLFTENAMYYLKGPFSAPTIDKVLLDKETKETIHEFCHMRSILESKGDTSVVSSDAKTFIFTVLHPDATVANTFLFYDVESIPLDAFLRDSGIVDFREAESLALLAHAKGLINEDVPNVIKLKRKIHAFIKKNNIPVDMYASGT